MPSQKSTAGSSINSTPGLSTAHSTQADDDTAPIAGAPTGEADLMAPDFSYTFLKGLDTISPFRPRSVHIPAKDLAAMGNMERQYWDIKAPHFDIVVFFKKGKFYELYDCDAVIANKEFGLKMVCDTTNRGKMRMAGVPEQSFSEWARLFVFRGYKIGRVEQMTVGGDGDDGEDAPAPAAKAAKVKIVPRDLVQILTSGTISDPSMINSHDALYVLALIPTMRCVKLTITSSADSTTTTTTTRMFYQVGIDATAVDVSRNIVLTCPSFTPTVSSLLSAATSDDNAATDSSSSSGEEKAATAADVAVAHLLDLVQGLYLRLSPKEVIVPANTEVMMALIDGAAAVKRLAQKTMSVNANVSEGEHTYMGAIPADVTSNASSYTATFPALPLLLTKLQKLAKNGFAASTNGESNTTYEELSMEATNKYHAAQRKLRQNNAESGANGSVTKNLNAITPASGLLGSYFGYLRLTNFDISDPMPFTGHCGGGDSENTASSSASASPMSPLSAAAAAQQSPLTDERRNDVGVFLDAAAIENIEIVANLRDGSVKHSIYNHMCRCTTASGKRLFRSWLLRPLSNPRCIRRRQEAVQIGLLEGNLYDLWGEVGGATGGGASGAGKKRARTNDIMQSLTQSSAAANNNEAASSSPSLAVPASFKIKHLFGMDLERQLSRLSILKNENTRVAYVDPLVQYSQNLDLILTSIEVFTELKEFAAIATAAYASSMSAANGVEMPLLLRELLGKMSAVAEPLDKVTAAFNVKKAIRDKEVKPERGMIAAYDEAIDELKQLDEQFANVLKDYFIPVFGTKEIGYCDIGKDLFLLEIPLQSYLDVEKTLTPGHYTERARTTKVVKVFAKGLEEHVESYKKHTTTKANGLVMVLRHLAGLLCDGFSTFFEAANAFSYLDCLMSLVTVHQQSMAVGGSCFPTIIEGSSAYSAASPSTSNGALIKASNLYHPMIPQPVSNEVNMTPESARVLLLTGPNMGGKSTMMRTIALAFLMAQLGGPVAAAECTLCPVTRIFTRIGARDAQHRGQSTLFVELKEMAEICNYADNYSLCLVDELGRGTSTHDGYAIAHATLSYLTGASGSAAATQASAPSQPTHLTKQPLVIFSTHYHALAIDVAQQQEAQRQKEQQQVLATNAAFDSARIQLAYMDFDLQQINTSGNANNNGSVPSVENSVSLLNDGGASNSVMSVGGGGGNGTMARSAIVPKITFLYKMVAGICHRSYGVEVAAVAGIPAAILKVAQQQSRRLAAATTQHQVMSMIRQIALAKSPEDLLQAARKASVIIAATKASV